MVDTLTKQANNSWLDTIGQAVGIYNDYYTGRTQAETELLRQQGANMEAQYNAAIAQANLNRANVLTYLVYIFGGIAILITLIAIINKRK